MTDRSVDQLELELSQLLVAQLKDAKRGNYVMMHARQRDIDQISDLLREAGRDVKNIVSMQKPVDNPKKGGHDEPQ